MAPDKPWLTAILRVLAFGLTISIFAAAIHDVSRAWDVWYYHLPFAARIWGIVPEAVYSLHPLNHARYSGFPLLCELLQGLFWRITGLPTASNLVAFSCLPLHAWFMRRFFKVPPHLCLIALLAIPLVHIHASSSYIDLPANTCVTALVLLVYHLATTEDALSRKTLLLALALAAGAANMRFQHHVIVGLSVLALGTLLLRRRAYRSLIALAVALPIIFASPLKNVIIHHNPYYPMQLSVAGISLPGTESVYSSSPHYLEHAPRPQRFLYSILEVGIRPLTSGGGRWTIDQYMPSDSTGPRMGGYFGAYVVFHLLLLGFTAARAKDRRAKVAAVLFGVVTVVTSVMPQSHELRYYLYWMMLLVSLNLALACRPEARSLPPIPPAPFPPISGERGSDTVLPGKPPLSPQMGGKGPGDRGQAPLLGAACTAALAVVLWATQAGYAYPSGSTFKEVVEDKVDKATFAQIADGDRVCLEKEPWTLLYAATFHPGRRFALREAQEPSDCGDFRLIK